MRVRPTLRSFFLVLLAVTGVLAGCLPSSFELAAERAFVSDPDFTLVFEDYIMEEGEATAFGRVVSYRVDNYAGLWWNEQVGLIAVLTTPSVNAMSVEANPVARMEPRELLDRILHVAEDEIVRHVGAEAAESLSVDREDFARLPTALGNFDGSRFALTVAEDQFTAFVLQGRHEEDIVVIGMLLEGDPDDEALDGVRHALASIEHPVPNGE